MPKRGRKFINEFLIPNLNEEKFGARLRWLDRELSIFQIQWNHKAASVWTQDDCQVFVEWDKKRGHYRPEEKEYFTKSKQRFRAVLNKSIQDHEITPLQSEDKNIKIYCLGSGDTIPDDFRFDNVKETITNDKNGDRPQCLRSGDTIPDDFRFDNVKETITNDKNGDRPQCLSGESDSTNSSFSLELDHLLSTNAYSNALKDHNYQNNEEHRIPESDYSTGYDASKNELSFYCSGNEKSVPTCFNILELTNDKVSLGNFSLPNLAPEELNLLLGYDDQDSHSTDTNLPASSAQENSSGIAVKRGMEYSDVASVKKSKLLIYVEKVKS